MSGNSSRSSDLVFRVTVTASSGYSSSKFLRFPWQPRPPGRHGDQASVAARISVTVSRVSLSPAAGWQRRPALASHGTVTDRLSRTRIRTRPGGVNRTRSLDSDSVRVCPTGNGIRAILDGPGPVTVPSPPRLRRRNLKHRGGSGSCQQKDNQVTSPARTGAGRPGPGPARPTAAFRT